MWYGMSRSGPLNQGAPSHKADPIPHVDSSVGTVHERVRGQAMVDCANPQCPKKTSCQPKLLEKPPRSIFTLEPKDVNPGAPKQAYPGLLEYYFNPRTSAVSHAPPRPEAPLPQV